jgi:hypothetical protein
MKAATAATAAATLLALATFTSGAPAPARRVRRQAPSGLDVINSVNSWTNDVIQVNPFLDSAATLSGDALAAAAQTWRLRAACRASLRPGSTPPPT